jgi:hypothetical protein
MSLPVSGNYYGAGAGVDGYTGKFIPEIWSGKLQVKFYAATCVTEICNSDWEGEIKDSGDKVNIRIIPTITINDYQKGMTLTSQVPTAAEIELLIDKGKYFSLVVDDVDAVQSDLRLMDMFSNDAAEQMKIKVEQQVFGTVRTEAHAKNMGATAGVVSSNINLGATGTPLAVTKTTVLDTIVDAGQVLDEQNVPETGRWFVIPPWFAAMIKKSDLKDASLAGDGTSILRNGRLGMIDRFTLYVNNNLTVSTDGANQVTNALFGTRDAVCFASQFTKMETLRAQTTFGNIVRGLKVYGFKTTKPEALGVVYGMKA